MEAPSERGMSLSPGSGAVLNSPCWATEERIVLTDSEFDGSILRHEHAPQTIRPGHVWLLIVSEEWYRYQFGGSDLITGLYLETARLLLSSCFL